MQALRQCNVLDTDGEPAFDDLTLLVSVVCKTPIALVSLVDESRQWFKSHRGLDASETPRDRAFCAHAILQPDDLLIVPDVRDDDRFRGNPLVVGPPHIRFYAGCPIVTADGRALGSVCVIDTEPRKLDDQQVDVLRLASRQAAALLDARRERSDAEREAQSLTTEVDSLRSRMSERAEFLAVAEHQLKTPLTIIDGWARLLRSSPDLSDEDRTAGLEALGRAVASLNLQVGDLLEAARAEVVETTLELVEVDVEAMIRDEIRSLAIISADHRIELTASVPSPLVIADREALHQVLVHVIENAIKYSPDGGLVDVRVSREPDALRVSVSDTGIGLPEGMDVFEPFQRSAAAKATAPGSGIGLHLVKTLVQSMRGSVSGANNADVGSTFTFALPSV